jgi:translocation and assembly module TamA
MRRILLLPFVAALVLVQDVALGADPQPYAVTLQPTGNDALDQALRDSSQLESLREKAPVGPFALITRARDDAARFQTALGSFGYYAAKVTVTVAGRPLDEADLPDLLRDVPAKPPVAVAVAFDPGPVFHLGRVTIEGEVPAAARDQLGLAPGAPAVAADVLAAQQRLLTAIREAGHPLA